MSDMLSRVHYKTVRAEIEGRFFSKVEAKWLIEAIKVRTIEEPQLRAMAAETWKGNA